MAEERIADLFRRNHHINRRDLIKRGSVLSLALPPFSALLAPRLDSAASRARATTGRRLPSAETPIPGQAGGNFVFGRRDDSVTFDPVLTQDNADIWVFINIYEQLVRVSNDGTTIEPALAETWDVSLDGLAYTFHLRPSVTFSDGTALKASDVKYSVNRAATTEESIWTFTLTALAKIETPDDKTVVMTLKEPWAPFLSNLAMFSCSILSEAFVAKVGEEKLAEQALGTGPFVLQSWTRGESVNLQKNPNYWQTGLPYLDTISVRTVPDDNTRILQLQSGELMGMSDIPLNRVPELATGSRFKVEKFPSASIHFIIINVRNSPLSDVKVRQALNLATDKETLIKSLLFDNGEASNSFMPNGTLYWNKDQPGYVFDLTKAQQLMSASSIPQGAKLSIMVNGESVSDQQIATALKDMWAKINIDLEIQPLDMGVISDNRRNAAFDLVLWNWTNDIVDPDELVSIAITPETNENFSTGWSNQEAIDFAKKARTTLDDAQRREMYYRIQQIHMEEAPFVYLYVTPYIDVVTQDVQNFVQHMMGHWVWKETWIQT